MTNSGPSAETLKAFRAERGWSQATLADNLLVAKRTVEDWETERRGTPPLLHFALMFLADREGLKARAELLRSGVMSTRLNGVDTTADDLAHIERRIAEYDQLLAQGLPD